MRSSSGLRQADQSRWVIEKYDSGDRLGVRAQPTGGAPAGDPGFGEFHTIPLLFSSLRLTRAAWLEHCIRTGYLVRGVSLPKEKRRFLPGPSFNLMPSVRFVETIMVERSFEIPTNDDLGVET